MSSLEIVLQFDWQVSKLLKSTYLSFCRPDHWNAPSALMPFLLKRKLDIFCHITPHSGWNSAIFYSYFFIFHDLTLVSHPGLCSLFLHVSEPTWCSPAGYNNLEVAEYLLEHGADVNAQDKGGLIPLHNAASYGVRQMHWFCHLLSSCAIAVILF